MLQTNRRASSGIATSKLQTVTKTMAVKFLGIDREKRAVWVSERAVNELGSVRHFTLMFPATKDAYGRLMYAEKAKALQEGTMIDITFEQSWDDEKDCIRLIDFKLID